MKSELSAVTGNTDKGTFPPFYRYRRGW